MNVQTCSEQLIYEIRAPACYYTPDCVADFSNVSSEQVGKDRVRVSGAAGRPRTDTLEASVGYKDGYIGSREIVRYLRIPDVMQECVYPFRTGLFYQ